MNIVNGKAMYAGKDQPEVAVDSDEIHQETSKKKRWLLKYFKYDGLGFRTSVCAFVVLVYLIIGAAIFLGLEGPQEEEQNTQVQDAQDQLDDVQDQIISLLTFAGVDNATAENLTNTLKQLTLQNSTGITDNWNFGSSLFFCTTIITTIGTSACSCGVYDLAIESRFIS